MGRANEGYADELTKLTDQNKPRESDPSDSRGLFLYLYLFFATPLESYNVLHFTV